jgi:hypothetical protein
MWGVTRRYTFDPANSKMIDKLAREGFVPLIRKAKGFVAYYWLDSGDGVGESFCLFEDKAGADESVHLAAEYVKAHLAGLLGKPEVTEGEVQAHT